LIAIAVTRLIRHKLTRAFLDKDAGWTPDMAKACRFEATLAVQRTVAQHKLENVELYYLFSDDGPSQWDFTVPLR
jgi:hypothetical protein